MTETAATLSQVAAHAGVSLATASRALNGSARKVNAELQARVLASAVELGYSPNVQAQAVARGTSNTVAIVVGDIADPYFSSIASGVIRVADERGLMVTITATGTATAEGTDASREAATLAALRGQRPRVVILAGSRTVDARPSHDDGLAQLSAIVRGGASVALIGPNVPGVRSVTVLNREGATALAVALQQRGYSDFTILAGPENLLTARDRTSGFLDAAPDARVVPGPFSREGGYETMAALLAAGDRPGCVFAVTDVMAVGAMVAMRDAGLTPGTEIAVAGFDDIPLVQDITPALTTVALPLADIGARALELALAESPDAALTTPFAGVVRLRSSTP
ncbi:LacI family DNA-binding transcriptional regulator [Leifsonia poae]|uniref:LacI family DNA-binding transcriptional regulator n=1 Tax=Leifsonia poae TaxID=110933 RepID=UPI001CBF119F|nr:LacI family DNA-binding transcriptional regulator [Leifsonia poae]